MKDFGDSRDGSGEVEIRLIGNENKRGIEIKITCNSPSNALHRIIMLSYVRENFDNPWRWFRGFSSVFN